MLNRVANCPADMLRPSNINSIRIEAYFVVGNQSIIVAEK